MSALTLSRRELAVRPLATLALFPSLGTTYRVWDRLLTELSTRHDLDVLLFDLPGHGAARPATGFTVADLVADAERLISGMRRGGPMVAVGVSMGGAIAVELARTAGGVVDALASFNSASRFGSEDGWEQIIRLVASSGTAAFDPEATMRGWFSPAFLTQQPGVTGRLVEDLAAVDAHSYIACCRALAAYSGSPLDGVPNLHGLAVGGAGDEATPAAGMRVLADASPGIVYVELPGAHLAIVENAAAAAGLIDRLVRTTLRPARSAA